LGLLCLLEMVFDNQSTNSNFFMDKLWLCGWPHSSFNNRFNSISITDKWKEALPSKGEGKNQPKLTWVK